MLVRNLSGTVRCAAHEQRGFRGANARSVALLPPAFPRIRWRRRSGPIRSPSRRRASFSPPWPKPAKPDWAGRYRGPIAMNYKTRAQIALNLGGLIADGFIAVEAQDAQQVKNTGGDIVKMAKALGVSENILARGNSINQFAENDEWARPPGGTGGDAKRGQSLDAIAPRPGPRHSRQPRWLDSRHAGGERSGGKKLRRTSSGRFCVSRSCSASFAPRSVRSSPELQNDPLVKSVNDQLIGIEQIVAKPFGQPLSARGGDEAERERQPADAGNSKEEQMMRSCDSLLPDEARNSSRSRACARAGRDRPGSGGA